jgi:phosphatidylethanolamine-binding protein (PEBP) family uncharacterized protein
MHKLNPAPNSLTPNTQVIPKDFVPSTLLNVSWGEKEVQLGNELTKGDTVNEPTITFAPAAEDDPSSTYTLAFLDPDAPSRADPKFGPFRHWVVSGVLLSGVMESEKVWCGLDALAKESAPSVPAGAKSSKEATTPYRPPGPGPGSGVHRYGK